MLDFVADDEILCGIFQKKKPKRSPTFLHANAPNRKVIFYPVFHFEILLFIVDFMLLVSIALVMLTHF